MLRRRVLIQSALAPALAALLTATGCRGKQVAHVLTGDDQDMVGSHSAGAETWKPLIEQSVGQLLARQCSEIHPASLAEGDEIEKKRVCFLGVENKSAEELGDSREQISDHIDSLISQSEQFRLVSRRTVDAGLKECSLKPEDLLVPANLRMFSEAMEQAGQPINYLLFAKITSLSTHSNGDSQRDYQLVLELVDANTGDYDKESATIRKGYHKSKLSMLKHY
jgi:Peptidoglycan-synthase activator LpoB